MCLFFIERSVMFLLEVQLTVFRHEDLGLLKEWSEGVRDSMVFAHPGHHNNIISNTLNTVLSKIIASTELS